MTHPTLARQLKRTGIESGQLPTLDQWGSLLSVIDATYTAADEDHDAVELSLRVSSRSMAELYDEVARQAFQLRVLVDALEDGVFVFDQHLEAIEFNVAALKMTGLTEEIASQISFQSLLQNPQLDKRVADVIRDFIDHQGVQQATHIEDVRLAETSGSTDFVSVSYIPVYKDDRFASVVVVLRDVSELKRYEIQLRHAQKLEAVGQLAAGVAHEINTPIQFISDNLTFFSDGFEATERVLSVVDKVLLGKSDAATAAYVDAAEQEDIAYYRTETRNALSQSVDGIERVANIVRAMKSFAHPGSAVPELADLNAAITNSITIASAEFRYVADVKTELADLPDVRCFLADLNQVLLNLIVNASHAIADRDNGRGQITVRSLLENGAVLIQVSDTGAGIPDAIRDRVFDPFFTTKEPGRGSGQGLALAYRVITQLHGGSLTFESKINVGTTFTIRLPLKS